METLNAISDWIARLMDYPLGWLLAINRDLAILIVAVGTSLVLTLARKWTTDQDRLRRCKQDIARLKQLRREAKRAKDRDAITRIKTTLGMISMTKMRAEGLPLLASVLPIALLAIWAFSRLDYYCPQKDEPIEVEANYPRSAIGKLAVLLPPDGVTADSCIQSIKKDPKADVGVARWKLTPNKDLKDANLVLRYEGETVRHPLTVGGHIYAAPIQAHPAKITASQVDLRQARFLNGFLGFGGIPGIGLIFPPWLTAYLVITIVFVPLLRKVMKVY